MSDEFDSLDAIERAGIEAALNRCRGLAAEIASEPRNKRPEHFVDKLSLADFYASLERAAGVLGQQSRQSVENAHVPVVKASQVRAVSATLVTEILFRLYFLGDYGSPGNPTPASEGSRGPRGVAFPLGPAR
jgi:hypothetical protein